MWNWFPRFGALSFTFTFANVSIQSREFFFHLSSDDRLHSYADEFMIISILFFRCWILGNLTPEYKGFIYISIFSPLGDLQSQLIGLNTFLGLKLLGCNMHNGTMKDTKARSTCYWFLRELQRSYRPSGLLAKWCILSEPYIYLGVSRIFLGSQTTFPLVVTQQCIALILTLEWAPFSVLCILMSRYQIWYPNEAMQNQIEC